MSDNAPDPCVTRLLTGQLDDHIEAMFGGMYDWELAEFGVARLEPRESSINEHVAICEAAWASRGGIPRD